MSKRFDKYAPQWRIQDFLLGGAPTRWGGTNLRHVHFLAKTYAKTKEIDPVGGARAAVPPPGSTNAPVQSSKNIKIALSNFGTLQLKVIKSIME